MSTSIQNLDILFYLKHIIIEIKIQKKDRFECVCISFYWPWKREKFSFPSPCVRYDLSYDFDKLNLNCWWCLIHSTRRIKLKLYHQDDSMLLLYSVLSIDSLGVIRDSGQKKILSSMGQFLFGYRHDRTQTGRNILKSSKKTKFNRVIIHHCFEKKI